MTVLPDPEAAQVEGVLLRAAPRIGRTRRRGPLTRRSGGRSSGLHALDDALTYPLCEPCVVVRVDPDVLVHVEDDDAVPRDLRRPSDTRTR